MTNQLNLESLRLHKKLRGKIRIESKISLRNRKTLSLLYTPGVALACREIARDNNQVCSLTIKSNTIAVITDGSAVLGLGNIGPQAALPVMEGKCAIFNQFADINAFPICLKTQNSGEIIQIISNISSVFGAINLEDISAPRCFEIESGLSDIGIPVMHDDQHATAIAVLAGLMNVLKVTGKKINGIKIVICGAGAGGSATA